MRNRWRQKKIANDGIGPDRQSALPEDEGLCSDGANPADTNPAKISLAEELLNFAYDAIRKEQPKLIKSYEALLSEEIHAKVSDIANIRRAQLQQYVKQCLAKTEAGLQRKKKIVRTIQTVNNIKETVAASLKASPQAALVWAALTFTLPLVLNASEQSIKNVEGIDLVLNILNKADILASRQLLGASEQPRRKVTEHLYRKILLFLIKTVVYYNQRSISRILGDSVKLDDWDEQLKAVRDADAQLDVFLTRMTRLSKEDNECLKKLHLTNPEDDKTRIEQRAGQLHDCYKWILDHASYEQWVTGNNRLLWIKGSPGKGKTMLLCGIINQGVSAYFFCQAPYEKSSNDNATAVLRGLVWMLARKNPHLIHHIRKIADPSADTVWSDINAFTALSRILKNMLADLPSAVLVIDALDECSTGRDELIELVLDTSEKTKWLVSSRRLSDIESMFSKVSCLSLDLETAAGEAVNSYINIRVQELAKLKDYDSETRTFIEHYLHEHSNSTFLWVALVCRELKLRTKVFARKTVAELPEGLIPLYKRMLDQVSLSRNKDILDQLLAIAVHVERPVSIMELRSIIEEDIDDEMMQELIQECGSFLTIRGDMVEFIHLSAQDHIRGHHAPSMDIKSVHRSIYLSSMRYLSRILKRNIYEVDSCIHVGEILPPYPDPLGASYALIHWTRHLEMSEHIRVELVAGSSLDRFFREDYLYWLEAVALKKLMPQAVHNLHELYSMTNQGHDDFLDERKDVNPLADFIYDARRFILYFNGILEENPLQIYDTGLVFCPANSLVRSAYKMLAPKWAELVRHPAPTWPPYLTRFSIKTGQVIATAYNSAGNLMAVASCDAELQIFNIDTGLLSNTARGSKRYFDGNDGHNGYYVGSSGTRRLEMVFSKDSSRLFFSYSARLLRSHTSKHILSGPYSFGVWDIHMNRVTTIVELEQPCRISPDTSHIAYEDQGTIAIADNKACIIGTIKPQNGTPQFFTFSIDGSILAIFTDGGYAELWTMNSCLQTILKLPEKNGLYFADMLLSHRSNILLVLYEPQEIEEKTLLLHGLSVQTGQCVWSHQFSCTFDSFGTHLWQSHDGRSLMSYVDSKNSHFGILDAHTGIFVSKSRTTRQFQEYASVHKARLICYALDWSLLVYLMSRINQYQNPRNRLIGLCPDQLCLVRETESGLNQYQGQSLDGDTIWEFEDNLKLPQLHVEYLRCLVTEKKNNELRLHKMIGRQLKMHASIEAMDLDVDLTLIADERFVIYSSFKAFWIWDTERRTISSIKTDSVLANDCFILHSDTRIYIWSSSGYVLIWSPDTDVQEVNLQDHGWSHLDKRLIFISPSGTYLAFSTSHQQASSEKLRILNISTKTVVADIDCDGILSAMVFSPCETKFVTSTRRHTRLWSISGIVLHEFDDCLFKTFYPRNSSLETPEGPTFTSETTIVSRHGVLTASSEGFSLGTTDEPFILGKWIYLNNQKIMRIPEPYITYWDNDVGQLKYLFYSKNRFAWQLNDIVVLQINPEHIPKKRHKK